MISFEDANDNDANNHMKKNNTQKYKEQCQTITVLHTNNNILKLFRN